MKQPEIIIKVGLHPILFRLLAFLAALFVLFPLAFSFFVPGNDLFQKISIALNISRFIWLSGIAISLFVFLAVASGKKLKLKFSKKNSLYLLIASLLLFSAYAFSLSDFDGMLREGAEVNGTFALQELPPDANIGRQRGPMIVSNPGSESLNPDAGRFLTIPLLADSLQISEVFLEARDQKLRKEVILEIQPAEDLTITWQGVWHGSLFFDNVFNPYTEVFLQVNGHDYNVTEQYASLPEHVSGWLEITISKEHLKQGSNKIELLAKTSEGIEENVGFVVGKGFARDNSTLFDGSSWKEVDGEILMYTKQSNNFLFSALFKLGFILKFLAVALLFLAVFGITFTRFALSKLRKELVFSILAGGLVYWFALVVEESTKLLAESTTFFVYFLLKVSGFNAAFTLQGAQLTVQLNQFAIRISEASAGANNVIYFLVAFSVLLLFNWKYLHLKKALVMYIPGAFGAFMVNVLRLYIVLVLGAFVSPDTARMLNEATGLLVFVAYFVLFWYLTLGFMEKRVKELKKKLRIRQ